MRVCDQAPTGLEEIVAFYGDCHAADFAREFIKWYRAPFVMPLSWERSTRVGGFLAHFRVGPVIVNALEAILAFRGLEYLREHEYDVYGGCFNPRGKVNGSGTSTHAWGIAIDWCPHLGPYGEPSKMPQFIVDAFTSHGAEWGGTWAWPDGMHFQWCHGY